MRIKKNTNSAVQCLSLDGIEWRWRFFVRCILVLLCCLMAPSAYATAPAQGGACTTNYTAAADATGNNLICISSVWQYPNYILSSTAAAGGGACSTAGSLHYNSTITNVEACNGSNWSALGGGLIGTINIGTSGQMAYYASTTNALTGNSKATISGGTLTLGVASTTAGGLTLEGSTSGGVTLEATSGTYNFILPTTAGSSGQPLSSAAGSSAMTFGPLAVAGGGTGNATLTAHGLLVGEGTSAVTVTAVGTTGTVLAGQGSSDPIFTSTPALGANSGTGGSLTLNGATSGSVIVQTNTAAGTGTKFQLPATNGTNTYVLQTDGTGVTSWVVSPTPQNNLGTSATATNPQISGTPSSGLYTSAAAHLDISIGSTQTADFSANTLNLTGAGGAYQINSVNAISFPTNDTTAGGTVLVGYSWGALPASAAYGDTGVGYNTFSSGSMTTAAINNTCICDDYGFGGLTSGAGNTITGNYVIASAITTGTGNTGIGGKAYQNGNLSYDTMIEGIQGASVGYDTSLGGLAGYASALGYDTSAGPASGNSLLTGQYNVCMGSYVCEHNVPSYMVAIGGGALTAGTAVMTTVNNYSVAVGDNSLENVETTALDNVALGHSSAAALLTGSHNILMGSAVVAATTSTSNSLNIAGLIEGDLTKDHLFFNGTAGTVAAGAGACGTSPSVLGNDNIGVITVGTSTNGSVCTLTFYTAWTTAPVCIVQDVTTANQLHPVTTTTTLAVTGTLTASNKVNYFCVGYQL